MRNWERQLDIRLVLISAVGMTLSIFISRTITKPIVKLHHGTEEIEKGNLDYEVGTKARDEIGQLSRAFDSMTANLKKFGEELKQYSRGLEKMVDDRTKELDDKIKELEMQRAATFNMLEDVNETKKELERANRDLEDFTSTVSHDLKVPLRAIQAFNTLLRDYYADTLDETGREYLDKSDKPKVEVSCEETGKSYLFKVKDNGIGVEENYLSSIFDIAERLNPQEYEGTGFGLNICKKIVEKFGGKIWAESKPGREGSTFCFTIPRN